MTFAVCLTILALVVCASSTSTIRPLVRPDKCIDITKPVPCDGYQPGSYNICNFCQHGYYARCDDTGLTILPCPHVDDDNGGYRRLVFDPATGICSEKGSFCPQRE